MPVMYGFASSVSCSSVAPDHADLGHRVDAGRHERGVARSPAGRTRSAPRRGPAPWPWRPAPAARRRRRPRRCAGTLVRWVPSTVDLAALVGLEAGALERQRLGVALPADGVEHCLRHDLLARTPSDTRAARSFTLSTALTFSRRRNVTLRRRRRYWNASPISVVEEVEHPLALVHDGDLGTERAEHRGVLDADDAGADHGHRPRHPVLELQHAVGVDDRAVVEVDRAAAARAASRRAMMIRSAWIGSSEPLMRHRVVVDERRLARQQADAVAPELLADDRRLGGDDPRGTVHQLMRA